MGGKDGTQVLGKTTTRHMPIAPDVIVNELAISLFDRGFRGRTYVSRGKDI